MSFEKSPQAQFLIPLGVSLYFAIVILGFMVLFVTPAGAVIIEDLRGHHRDKEDLADTADVVEAGA